jgi:hypothetical protein
VTLFHRQGVEVSEVKTILIIAVFDLLISSIIYTQIDRTNQNIWLDRKSFAERNIYPQQNASGEAQALSPIEIAALINDCGVRTTQMTWRLYSYTFRETDTEYGVDKQGQVKSKQSKVYEVYPLIIGKRSKWVYVQVSENDTSFSAERIARERERIIKDLTEIEASAAKAPPPKTSSTSSIPRFSSYGIKVEKHSGLSKTIWFINPTDFFMSHDFYAPHRVTFMGREAIQLSFRPRPNYVYDKTNVLYPEGVEDYGHVMAQLGGIVWIDASDKVIMRLEAIPIQELSGLNALSNDSSNIPIGFELMRLPEGTWVPSRSWYNSYGREKIFWKTAINRTRKYSDFKLFKTSVEMEKLDSPPGQP